MSKHFLVSFRGENETSLRPWRPEHGKFGCTSVEAQERHDDLVEAAEAGTPIDGVVPFVVDVQRVKIHKKCMSIVSTDGVVQPPEVYELREIKTMLTSWVDGKGDVTQSGPWAPSPLPDPATLN